MLTSQRKKLEYAESRKVLLEETFENYFLFFADLIFGTACIFIFVCMYEETLKPGKSVSSLVLVVPLQESLDFYTRERSLAIVNVRIGSVIVSFSTGCSCTRQLVNEVAGVKLGVN